MHRPAGGLPLRAGFGCPPPRQHRGRRAGPPERVAGSAAAPCRGQGVDRKGSVPLRAARGEDDPLPVFGPGHVRRGCAARERSCHRAMGLRGGGRRRNGVPRGGAHHRAARSRRPRSGPGVPPPAGGNPPGAYHPGRSDGGNRFRVDGPRVDGPRIQGPRVAGPRIADLKDFGHRLAAPRGATRCGGWDGDQDGDRRGDQGSGSWSGG